MSICDIKVTRELRREGKRLDREGLSQRVDKLVLAFAKKYPNGDYREGIMLAGRLHAIFLAIDKDDYWREVAERGFNAELWDLKKFQRKEDTDI